MTFKEVSIKILQEINKPLSSSEIWNEIKKQKLVQTNGKTPEATLSSVMLFNSENSSTKKRYKNTPFTIISHNPNKYQLVKDVENLIDDDTDIKDIENNEPYYECVMDDNETILKIFNIDGTLNYKTEKGNEFTYFIQDKPKNLIKIGKTGNIQKRYNTFRTANPDIEILLIIPKDEYEKYYHDRFKKYNHDLEWYFLVNEIKEFLKHENKKRTLAIDCYFKYEENYKSEENFLKLF